MAELRAHFRPEFSTASVDIVLFKPLRERRIERIVELRWPTCGRLADRRIALELTDSARELIARSAYDPVYGARPLRRFIQREVGPGRRAPSRATSCRARRSHGRARRRARGALGEPRREEAPDAAGRGDEDVVDVEVEEEAETGEEALR
jgi:hypothetical protein